MSSQRKESGQALVLGLGVFALAALGVFYLLHKMRFEQKSSLQRTENWVNGIRRCQDASHMLNTIAIHNHSILKSLAKAANTWNEAAEWSLALANAQPFWQKTDPIAEPRFLFEKFAPSAKMSFTMAAANSHQASRLAQDLMRTEKALQGVLTQTSNVEALCTATQKHFQNVGLYWTSHSQCALRILTGNLVQFSLAIQSAPAQSFGIVVISNFPKMRSWMRECRKAENENLSIVIRNKRFESAAGLIGQKQKEQLLEAMLVPAWTASLEVKGLALHESSL